VLPKLVQNALCVIEKRAVRLMYIIIRYETLPCAPMTYSDLAGPSQCPLHPHLGQNHRRPPHSSHP
jgi:hypothetical protein